MYTSYLFTWCISLLFFKSTVIYDICIFFISKLLRNNSLLLTYYYFFVVMFFNENKIKKNKKWFIICYWPKPYKKNMFVIILTIIIFTYTLLLNSLKQLSTDVRRPVSYTRRNNRYAHSIIFIRKIRLLIPEFKLKISYILWYYYSDIMVCTVGLLTFDTTTLIPIYRVNWLSMQFLIYTVRS